MEIKILNENIYYSFEKSKTNKPLVVFIHGVGGHAETGERYLVFKNRNYNLFCFDLIGRGKSSFNKAITVKLWIQNIIKLLQSLKIDNFSIFAHSFGCYLATEIINCKKFKIKQSLFVAPYNPFVLESDLIRSELIKVYPKLITSFSNQPLISTFKELLKIYVEIDQQLIQKYWSNDFITYLKNLGVLSNFLDQNFHDEIMFKSYQKANNYQIIAGNNDMIVPLISIKKLAQTFNKKLVILPGKHDVIKTQMKKINDYLNLIVK